MPNPVSFEKVRKRRRKIETIKRLSILALIFAVVAGAVALNNLLVQNELSLRISDLLELRGGTGFPADLPGGIVRDIKPIGRNLAVLTDTNLLIYNERGRAVSNTQRMTDRTVMLTNQSRALSFDPGSRAYRIHTPARTDYHEPENGIISAALADNNMFALVTSARQFVAEAAVYRSPTEEPVFRWLSPDNHITGVALSPRGTHMAVACVMTEGGMLKSQAVLFQLDSTDMVEIGFPGSLILQLEYTDARLCILTDREYAVFDYSGESLFSYDLGSDPVSAIRSYDGETLLLTEYREARTSRLVLLDESLTVTAQHSAPNNIKGIEIGRRRIYVLDDSGIEAFDRQLNSMEKTERRGITHMQLVDGKLYYTTADEIFLFD